MKGVIKFYEDAPQRFNTPKEEIKYAKLNVYGVTNGEGSFVKDINLDSELSDKFATQISIGAQAGGNELSSNATSFSSYNEGLIDRMVKTKSNKKNPRSSNTTSPKETLLQNWGLSPGSEGKVAESFLHVYVRMGAFQDNSSFWSGVQIQKLSEVRSFNSEYIDILNEFNKQYASVLVGSLQQEKQIPNFFLPFNLKLTIDGMSGMTLYQQFQINTKILPVTYDEHGVNYIIKGLNHSVDSNSWSTEIETTPVSPPTTTPIITETIPSREQTEPSTIERNIQEAPDSATEFIIRDNISDGEYLNIAHIRKILQKKH